MWPLGFIAILAGWFVTEQGRQPWLVHGLLRTLDGISPVPGASVAGTLVLFVCVYGVVPVEARCSKHLCFFARPRTEFSSELTRSLRVVPALPPCCIGCSMRR